MTSMEREEKEKVKKREKKLEDEEILQQATWVKYTIPIKHQVSSTLELTCAISRQIGRTRETAMCFKMQLQIFFFGAL